MLSQNPAIATRIKRPSDEQLQAAVDLLQSGTVAASDGTVSPVPLVAGSKIQVGVVIVSNTGSMVSLVTKVFETELNTGAKSASEFFQQLRTTRAISNLVSRAIMLFGERNLLIEHQADWRMIHGELIPHELRTGAGRPSQNLPPTFDLINRFIASERFIAVSESSDDIDILNAAILLEPGEYIVIRSMADTLGMFLDGDLETGTARANFAAPDLSRFREFIARSADKVAVVLTKAADKPFLIECHSDHIDESVALFLADSLWTRGHALDGMASAIRGFPYHIDLADQVARTLLKGGEFRSFVEARLLAQGLEEGLFDLDARRTRG
ncbi:MAG: hypothetical protein QY327_09850 [Fimbriimonadaceae bacterium]|nr:MAG: hypothetical protein QY327_09850 [Fimbriimonadaceae bacterium]